MNIDNIVDCSGDNCPIPLIKTREAIMNAKKGDIIKVTGTHQPSFEEIPMALEAMNIEIIEKQPGDKWHIIFEV